MGQGELWSSLDCESTNGTDGLAARVHDRRQPSLTHQTSVRCMNLAPGRVVVICSLVPLPTASGYEWARKKVTPKYERDTKGRSPQCEESLRRIALSHAEKRVKISDFQPFTH